MKRQRLYLDTSVIGGCYDDEFAEDSNRLFDAVRAGRATALISPVTLEELTDAPPPVQQVLRDLPDVSLEVLVESAEVVRLAEAYLAARVVSEQYRGDAVHVAFATANGADVLVSWNFRHIVNLRRIRLFNAVNLAQGYPPLEIRSPRELYFEDDDAGEGL